MSTPVTVSITRHLDPGREVEMRSWLQAGTALAQQFPGFLGAGWVRPELDSETWHMRYRFADAESLQAGEQSPQRQWSSGGPASRAGSTSRTRATSATCASSHPLRRGGSRRW